MHIAVLGAVISLTLQQLPGPGKDEDVFYRTSAFRRLALLAGHCEKRGYFLFYILAAAVRAADVFLVVFVQGEHCLKRLIAVVADVVVYGHGEHLACGLCQNCNSVGRGRRVEFLQNRVEPIRLQ